MCPSCICNDAFDSSKNETKQMWLIYVENKNFALIIQLWHLQNIFSAKFHVPNEYILLLQPFIILDIQTNEQWKKYFGENVIFFWYIYLSDFLWADTNVPSAVLVWGLSC